MSIADLLIVYLACGSPVAVYHFTSRPQTVLSRDIAAVTYSFVFWPIAAARLLMRIAARAGERKRLARQNIVEQIRLEIEHIALTDRSPSVLFRFREIFHRFTGLNDAAEDSDPTDTGLAEIFLATDHPDVALATRCLRRRNKRLLRDHASHAHGELVEMLAVLADSESKRN